MKNLLIILSCSLVGFSSLHAQFNNASQLLGSIHFTSGSPHGNGISFYDFNKDGWDDLSFAGNNQQLQFLINNNGSFEPAAFTIPNPNQSQINMILWADYDNDGDSDLLITKQDAPIQLWQNDGNFNFTNVAAIAGLEQANFFYTGAAFCDYNHDGCLDLYIGKFYHSSFNPGLEYRGMLYKSNCNGTFEHVTQEAGVLVSSRPIFQPVFLDYNNDGWEDLYLITDRVQFPNELFQNNGDGTFTSVTQTSGAGINIDAMSGTIGDYDNDGDLDIFCTNNPYAIGHILLQNQGNGSFIQMQNESGLYLSQVGWGSMWLDYDNDSYQDLFVSVTSPLMTPIGNQFYVNQGNGTFLQSNEDVGLGGDLTETYVAAMGDIDNDGYYDFMTNNVDLQSSRLYHNTAQDNNYFAFSLQGTISNKEGIGTWVHCYADGHHYVRFTLNGENLLGQNSSKIIFGLGEAETVDSLIIDWNRGTHEVYYNLEANQHLHFVEGASFSLPFVIELSDDAFLCDGDSIILDAGVYDTYLWNTGATERYITIYEPGVYQVTVTEIFGIPIESLPVEILSAPAPEITIDAQPISCFGLNDGSIAVQISNSPVQSINWSNGMTDQQIENLESGVYSFIAYDSYGCQAIGSATITEPLPLLTQYETGLVSCFGGDDGYVVITPQGGIEPYLITCTGGCIENQLSAGSYQFIVTDSNNCSTELIIQIAEPEPLEVLVDVNPQIENTNLGDASATINGGTPPYDILWSTGESANLYIDDLEAGEYSISVEDFNGCTLDTSFEIAFLTSVENNLKNHITIAPNPANHQVKVSGFNAAEVQIGLYNAHGQLVYYKQRHSSIDVIDLMDVCSGIYTIRLTDGQLVYTARLIVQK